MDADYLKRTVGGPLAEALTSMVVKQPTDAVEFLGEYLLDYVRRNEVAVQRDAHAAKMADLLRMAGEEEARKEQEQAALASVEQQKAAEDKAVEAALPGWAEPNSLCQQVLDLLCRRTGATGAYVGRRELHNGQQIVTFLAASKGQEKVPGQVLRGLREGEEASEEASEEGVTFRLWKKTETPPPKPPQLDEEGNPVEDTSEPELITPAFLHIQNVIREPAMKFFGIPKLGAYLAVPVPYQTWLHPAGVVDAAEATPTEADGDDQEDAKTDKRAGAAGKDAAAPYKKNLQDATTVLCVDTVGQGRCFKPEEIAYVRDWAGRLGRALEGLEGKLFDKQVAALQQLKGDKPTSLLASKREEASSRIAAALGALPEGDGVSEEERKLVEAEARYAGSVSCLEALRKLMDLTATLPLAPKAEAVAVFEAALLLLGGVKSSWRADTGAGPVLWPDGMCPLIGGDKLASAAVAFQPKEEGAVALVACIRDAVESADVSAVEASSIAAAALLDWAKAAVALCDAAVARRAQEAAAKAAAEEAARAQAEADAAEAGAQQDDD